MLPWHFQLRILPSHRNLMRILKQRGNLSEQFRNVASPVNVIILGHSPTMLDTPPKSISIFL